MFVVNMTCSQSTVPFPDDLAQRNTLSKVFYSKTYSVENWQWRWLSRRTGNSHFRKTKHFPEATDNHFNFRTDTYSFNSDETAAFMYVRETLTEFI